MLAAKAQQRDAPVTLRTIGTVEAFRTVDVCARVGGQLTQVHFREGQDVKQGDLLFSLDARPYQAAYDAARADLMRQQAQSASASADARRLALLQKSDYVTPEQYDEAVATARADSAAVAGSAANLEDARLNVEYCTIRASIPGRTGNLLIHEGNLVRANDSNPLLVINQISPIFVGFSVPEGRLPEIMAAAGDAGAGHELEVDAAPPGSTGAPPRGALTFVNNTVDPATGTVLLKAEFPNEDRKLWPGQFVEVTLILGIRRGAVVVPASAVQTSQKGSYVFVIGPDLTAEMRPVTPGPALGDEMIVEKGLQPGETVVTDGHLRVVPGGKVVIKSGSENGDLPSGGGTGAEAAGSGAGGTTAIPGEGGKTRSGP